MRLHSFPTRRSSDLGEERHAPILRGRKAPIPAHSYPVRGIRSLPDAGEPRGGLASLALLLGARLGEVDLVQVSQRIGVERLAALLAAEIERDALVLDWASADTGFTSIPQTGSSPLARLLFERGSGRLH